MSWFDRNFRSLNGLKNTFKLLSIDYNLLRVHRTLGCTPFEAGDVEKLNYYEVWDKLLRSDAHDW